jgi:hypothetical protein
MRFRSRLSYANVVSTIALCLALSGGIAVAASQIDTENIKADAVTTGKIAPGAVTAKRLADSAVRTRQLARQAVQGRQVAKDTVGPNKLKFPVYYVVSPSGGSASVSSSPQPYPLQDGEWTQEPGEINVIFGAGEATLAYDGTGSGACEVYFDIRMNGQQVGGGNLRTDSTSPTEVSASLGAQPTIDPLSTQQNVMTVQTGSNGDCTPSSTIDSTRFRVLDFG